MRKPSSAISEFQTSFGTHISLPFDFSTGKFRLQTEKYEAALLDRIHEHKGLSATDRLGAYNGQYWFRLLSILQGDFPLLSQLLGLWKFNQIASEFLHERPSTSTSLSDLAPQFHNYLQGVFHEQDLLQAAWIDLAYNRVFTSSAPAEFDPTGESPSHTLSWNSSVELIKEDRALIEQRQNLDPNNEKRLELPQLQSKYWVVYRLGTYIHTREIEVEFYTLLNSLKMGLSLDQSFEELSQKFPDSSLESMIPQWFQIAMELKWWKGWQKCEDAHTS